MPMKNNREYRDMVLEVVVDQDKPEEEREERKTVAGYASTFNEPYVLYEDEDLIYREQVDVKPYAIDADQMKQIRENVFNYFGVSEGVLQNSAKNEDLEAFFDGAIEPFAIQLSEAMTKMLFSERERAQGSYLIANANRLQYMITSQKVQMAKELGDRGAIMIDEIRELFNYAPLPNGAGQVAPIRGEYKATDELTEGEDNANEE